MATRLTLLCHAATAAMRDGGFPGPEDPLDDGGLRKAGAYRLCSGAPVMVSPARAARQTAEALGLEASVVDDLRDIDHGDWAGQGFAAVGERDSAALAAWIADPARGTPGGESLSDVLARLAPWLEAQAARDAPVVAITHAMVIRAALAAALDMPLATVMRIDVAPLSATTLSFNRVWRLQAICTA